MSTASTSPGLIRARRLGPMSAKRVTAIDQHDGRSAQCWCCGSIGVPDRMVHLKDHPEVHLCLQCVDFVHQRAWEIGGHPPRLAPEQVHRRHTPLARQVSSIAVDIELLVIPDCPNGDAAAELITAAVAATRVQASITRTIIASQDQALRRGFTGSPTILLNGVDPFAQPGAPVALACRLYNTPDGLRGVPSLPDLRQALTRVAAG